MKTLALILFFVLDANVFVAQNFSISGTVKDASNGETIGGATIFLKEINRATAANNYGFYSLTAPAGRYTLIISYIGFQSDIKTIDLNKNMVINIAFATAETNLEEVEVSTRALNQNVKSTQMGVVQLDMTEIKKVPAFMGEVDILKTIQLLPGIKKRG